MQAKQFACSPSHFVRSAENRTRTAWSQTMYTTVILRSVFFLQHRYASIFLKNNECLMKRFQRKIEDFECLNCGQFVKGNGYTNHCPKCLWSRHVDINPGDRGSDCGGLMKPISFFKRSQKNLLLHKCLSCGLEKTNKLDVNDDFHKALDVDN